MSIKNDIQENIKFPIPHDLNDPSLFGSQTKKIVSGYNHICVKIIKSKLYNKIFDLINNQIQCWGDNVQNQIDVPGHLTNINVEIEELDAGGDNTCAQVANGGLVCWGDNGQSQNDVDGKLSDLKVMGFKVGGGVVCAWGEKDRIMDASGINFDVYNPNHVRNGFDGPGPIESQNQDQDQSYIRNLNYTNSIQISCWGNCNHGLCDIDQSKLDNLKPLYSPLIPSSNLILNLNPSSPTPTTPPDPPLPLHSPLSLSPIEIIHDVQISLHHACLLAFYHPAFKAGSLYCWGTDLQGETKTPEPFKHHTEVVAVGTHLTCAILVNQNMQCWGSTSFSSIPKDVMNVYSEVSAGGRHACGIRGGILHCWGSGEQYQTEVPVKTKDMAIQVSAGWDQTCAVDLTRDVRCWGFNFHGQVDVPEVGAQRGDSGGLGIERVDIRVIRVESGLQNTCMVYNINNVDQQGFLYNNNQKDQEQLKVGQLNCWGRDFDSSDGQGINHIDNAHLNAKSHQPNPNLNPINPVNPEQTPLHLDSISNTPISGVTVGDDHLCVWNPSFKHAAFRCWGDNSYGQSDIDSQFNAVGSDSHQYVRAVQAGGAHTCLLHVLLHCFGADNWGQSRVPDDVGKSEMVFNAAAGTVHSCAIVKDRFLAGQLRCWGQGQGQGQGQRQEKDGVGMTWRKHQQEAVSAGFNQQCALDREGGRRCYGDNDQRQCDG